MMKTLIVSLLLLCANFANAQHRSMLTTKQGGTGDSTLTAHGVMLGEGISKVAVLTPGDSLKFLQSMGASLDPIWVAISGTGTVTSIDVSGGSTGLTFSGGPVTTSGTITMAGLLAVPYGGTGAGTWNANGVLYGNGASTLGVTSPGASGKVLTGNGSGSPPTFQDVPTPTNAVITNPGNSIRNLITPLHDTIVPITANIVGTSTKHIQNWDIDSVVFAYVADDGGLVSVNNIVAGQDLYTNAGNLHLANGTLTFPGSVQTWIMPDSSGTVALLQNIPHVSDTDFVKRWPTTDAQSTITTLDTTVVPFTIKHASSSTGYFEKWYNGGTLVGSLDANSGPTMDLNIHGIITTTGSGINADINGGHDISASRNLSADSSLLLNGFSGTGTLTLTGLTVNRTWLLPNVSGTLVPLDGLSVGNQGVVIYDGSKNVSSPGTTSGYVLTSRGIGLTPTWQAATGAVTSVANSDGTLTISPTTGSVVASIALAHANTWTGAQTIDLSGAGGSTPALNLLSPSGASALSTRDHLGNLVFEITEAGKAISGRTGGTGGSFVINGSTSGSATIDAPAVAGTSTLFRVPGNNGTNGYVLAVDGFGVTSWIPNTGSGGTVTSVTGTTNRITVGTGTTTPVIDISGSYVGQSSITTLGTIATGVWNGTGLDVAHGGTGQASLTAHNVLTGNGTSGINSVAPGATGNVLKSNGTDWTSAAPATSGTVTSVSGSGGTTGLTLTGGPITASGTLTLGGTLGVANGGTGNTVYNPYAIVFADNSGATLTTNLGLGTTGQFLTSGGAGAAPTWTTTLPVSNGGTGATTLTGILKGNGTSAVTAISIPSDATKYLDGTGAFTVPPSSGPTKYSVTTTDAINTTSLVNILSISIPANTLADGETIYFYCLTNTQQLHGSAVNMTFGASFGATSGNAQASSIANSAVSGWGYREVIATRIGTSLYVLFSVPTSMLSSFTTNSFDGASNSTGVTLTSLSFTSTQTLTINATWGTADANTFFKIKTASAIKF